ncbi:hypothetical protein IFM89_024411, partial [Coptis chinensis]
RRGDVEGSLFVVKRILSAYSKVPPKLKVSSTKRDLNLFGTGDGEIDFEESETVEKNVMEVLLESPSSNSTAPNVANTPEDSSFLKFFNTATSITNASNAANPGQYQPPAVILPSFRSPNVPTTVPALELPYAPSSSISYATSFVYIYDTINIFHANCAPSPVSREFTAAYGGHLLQAFPPPTPPPSLTPTTPINGLGITRDKVRDTLMRLVQIGRSLDERQPNCITGWP